MAALGGCAGTQEPEVRQVAAAFGDPDTAPAARCDLLAPATVSVLMDEESTDCADAITRIPLGGGPVESVEVWGQDAQVRLADDTLFLTRTPSGWRVAAASCRPGGDGPYRCELEGP